METCLQPLWNLLRDSCSQLFGLPDFQKDSCSEIFTKSHEKALRECESILNMFWKSSEGYEYLQKPKHIEVLCEAINKVINGKTSIGTLEKDIQHAIDESTTCKLCAVCHKCSRNFYNQLLQGQFIEKNLPYELRDYFNFKPQMYYYKESMHSEHTHIQLKDNLFLLKGFSSSTPTIHSAVFNSNCMGGGLYINYKGTGIAIDPGIGFVKLMHQNGIYIEDVNIAIVTHDHLDHNADAETISSLAYDFNSYNKRKDSLICEILEIDKSPEHEINWIMDGDSYNKLKTKIASCDKLENYQEREILSDGEKKVTLSSIHTKHIKGSEESYAIKLKFRYERTYTIGYTSDTAYFEELSEFFEDVDILIFNVSDIYIKDVKGIKDKNSHLGYNGSRKILRNTKARVAIASEFCCTNGDFRMNFIRSLKNELDGEFKGIILPGEIGMKISIPDNYIECSICKQKVSVQAIHALNPVYDYEKIQYVCSKCMV